MAKAESSPQLHVQLFEQDLGLPHGWYFALMKDSDWTFVIKLFALCEGAINYLLQQHFENRSVSEFLARLNMNGRTGKLRLSRKLAAIGSDESRFIEKLADIRNHCIHDVRNVSFVFSDYYAGLKSDQKKMLLALFEPFIHGAVGPGSIVMPLTEFVEKNWKLSFWMAGIQVLSSIYLTSERARVEATWTNNMVKTGILSTKFDEIFPASEYND